MMELRLPLPTSVERLLFPRNPASASAFALLVAKISVVLHVIVLILAFLAHLALRRLLRVKEHGWGIAEWPLVCLYRLFFRNLSNAERRIMWGSVLQPLHKLTLTSSGVKVQWDEAASGWWLELSDDADAGQQAKAVKADKAVTLIFTHGGGFSFGHGLIFAEFCAALLKALRGLGVRPRIFSLEYPLTPEAPYPQALDCYVKAYQLVAAQCAARGEHVMCAGDSAGGNLVLTGLATIRALRAEKGAKADGSTAPALAAILISPWVDMGPSAEAYAPLVPLKPGTKENPAIMAAAIAGETTGPDADAYAAIRREADLVTIPTLTEPALMYIDVDPGTYTPFGGYMADGWKIKLEQAQALARPLVSPMFLDSFSGLVAEQGRMLVLAGGLEVFLPDIKAFAAKASKGQAPGSVRLHVQPGGTHDYLLLPVKPWFEPGVAMVAEFMAEALAAAGGAPGGSSS